MTLFVQTSILESYHVDDTAATCVTVVVMLAAVAVVNVAGTDQAVLAAVQNTADADDLGSDEKFWLECGD